MWRRSRGAPRPWNKTKQTEECLDSIQVELDGILLLYYSPSANVFNSLITVEPVSIFQFGSAL